MADIASHHLIYGKCTDFINGETLVDTDDERIRQGIARLLVNDRGYDLEEIIPRLTIETLFNQTFVVSKIDFAVRIAERIFMIIRYGPGSLVTRERPAIAAARVLSSKYLIPLAVVTNGRDAELLDTADKKVIATGMEAIPTREQAMAMIAGLSFRPGLDEKAAEREKRIMNAFDLEICCAGGPCALPGAKEG